MLRVPECTMPTGSEMRSGNPNRAAGDAARAVRGSCASDALGTAVRRRVKTSRDDEDEKRGDPFC